MIKDAVVKEELVLPEQQVYPYPTHVRLFGLAARWLVILLSVFSLPFFISRCIFPQISTVSILAVCLAATVIGTIMSLSGKLFVCGLAFISVVGGGFLLFFPNGSNIAANAPLAGSIIWHNKLSSYSGVDADLPYDLSAITEEAGVSIDTLFVILFLFVTFILGIVLTLTSFRRVRLPALIILAAPTAALLYFGFCESTAALILILASVFSLISLSCYDSIYLVKGNIKSSIHSIKTIPPHKREVNYTAKINSYLGGYTALTAALLTLILLSPTLFISHGMRDIPAISLPAARADAFITTVLGSSGFNRTGSTLPGGNIPEKSRSAAATKRSYSDTKILEVYTDAKYPIYLRQWTGADYFEDSWHAMSEEEIAEYKGKFGRGFTSELLSAEFLRIIDPSLISLPDGASTMPHLSLGYVTAPVYINKLTLSTTLVLTPSYADQRVRFLKYGTLERSGFNYTNYCDGIYTDTTYLLLDKYGMMAHIPVTTPESAESRDILLKYFKEQCETVIAARRARAEGRSAAEIKAAYRDNFTEFSEFFDGYILPRGEKSLAYRYVFTMTENEQAEVDTVIDNLSLYNDYVTENYLATYDGCEEVKALAEKIMEEAGLSRNSDSVGSVDSSRSSAYTTFADRHAATTAVAAYLSDNMTYTLNPTTPKDGEHENAVEAFLFGTKEGYCVQYATASVILLRSIGIPARYAEGYVAKDFVKTQDGTPSLHMASVKDSNAHAWIEVYFENYGWVPYEVTFAADEFSQNVIPDSPQPDDTEDNPYNQDTADNTSAKSEKADNAPISPDKLHPSEGKITIPSAAVVILLIVLLSAVISVLIIVFRRRIAVVEESYRQIENAGLVEGDAERINLGRKIGDAMMKLLSKHGIEPMPHERWEDFLIRAEAAISGISDSLRLIRKCEFASSVSKEELSALSRAFLSLLNNTVAKLGRPRGFFLRYFSRLV